MNTRLFACVAAAAVAATLVVAPAVQAKELCYWSQRHEKGCRNQPIYLSKKKPPVTIVLLVGKGEPCDEKGCPA